MRAFLFSEQVFTMEFKCPKCKKPIPSATTGKDGKKKLNGRFFPFCSQRCKLIDMGAWLDAEYRIPTKEEDADQDESEEDKSPE